MRKVAVRIRPADVVDPTQLFRDRFGPEIIRPHRVDETERPALLARAIIRQHQDQRVVTDAGSVEERDQPRQMLVGVIEHAGKRRLQSREDTLFVGTVLFPCLHAVIARRQSGLRRHDAGECAELRRARGGSAAFERIIGRQVLLRPQFPADGQVFSLR